jgi:hypothetical protein
MRPSVAGPTSNAPTPRHRGRDRRPAANCGHIGRRNACSEAVARSFRSVVQEDQSKSKRDSLKKATAGAGTNHAGSGEGGVNTAGGARSPSRLGVCCSRRSTHVQRQFVTSTARRIQILRRRHRLRHATQYRPARHFLSIAVDVAIKSFSNCGRPRRFEPRDSSVHCRLTQYHPAHKFLGVYVAWHGS